MVYWLKLTFITTDTEMCLIVLE